MCADKVAFTEPRVGKFAAPAKGYALYWDAETPGLGLRVTAKGVRRYVFEKRVHGDTCRMKIGDPEAWPLKKAQARARELAVLVDKGLDPRIVAAEKTAEDKATRRELQRQDLVLADVWESYIAANKAGWGERHLADHTTLAQAGGQAKKRGKGKTKPGPLAALMPLKLSELTGETVGRWLEREAKHRATNAAQSYRLLRAFVRWAAEVPEYRGVIPADAYSARVVRKALPSPQVKDGDCLQKEQLPAWFDAVRARSNPVIAAYLQALLLTGARREQLLSLKWGDVTVGTAPSLTLRTTAKSANKGGNVRTIPLTPYVALLLDALPGRRDKNAWVFGSDTSESGRLMEPRIAHDHALEAGGLPHITLHGLRRSFGTLAEWLEIPTGVVAQIQGHKPSAVAEKHYRRRPLDMLRLHHERLEAWILNEAGVVFTRPGEKPKLGTVNTDGTVQRVAS
jgi:integrase